MAFMYGHKTESVFIDVNAYFNYFNNRKGFILKAILIANK